MMWAPLRHLATHTAGWHATSDIANWIIDGSSCERDARYAREIIEVVIRLRCADRRVSWLSADDKHYLTRFGREDPGQLLSELERANRYFAMVGWDTNIDVTVALSHDDRQGMNSASQAAAVRDATRTSGGERPNGP